MNPYDDEDTVDELPARPRQSISEADRELLELAGRAIGAVRVEDVDGENWVNLHFADGSIVYGWNSLVHSDDMLNLSALLRIDIVWQGESEVFADGIWPESTADDPGAAARRAVTRAAADIYKQRSS